MLPLLLLACHWHRIWLDGSQPVSVTERYACGSAVVERIQYPALGIDNWRASADGRVFVFGDLESAEGWVEGR